MSLYYQLEGKFYKNFIHEAGISFQSKGSFIDNNDVVILESEDKNGSIVLQRVSIIKNFSEQQVSETEVDEDVKTALLKYGSKAYVFINKDLKVKEAYISQYNICAFENLNIDSTERIKFKFSNIYYEHYDDIYPSKTLNRLLKVIKEKQLNNISF